MIYNHLDEIQNALSIVGGQKFATNWDEGVPVYWSSTEHCAEHAWVLYLTDGGIDYWDNKYIDSGKVRPISKFITSSLKESFTKKIKKTSNKDLVDIADKLASTNYDYNEENFIRKLRKETEQYYKSEFYKVYHYPLDYRHNGDIWPADEDGFHNMYLESTYWAEKTRKWILKVILMTTLTIVRNLPTSVYSFSVTERTVSLTVNMINTLRHIS